MQYFYVKDLNKKVAALTTTFKCFILLAMRQFAINLIFRARFLQNWPVL